MGDIFLAFVLMFVFVMVCLSILCIPIMIANARGICGGEKTAIIILSLMGVLFGVTWIVALILSLIWQGSGVEDVDNLDKLEKLSRLYKDKAITKDEYEKLKSKLLK